MHAVTQPHDGRPAAVALRTRRRIQRGKVAGTDLLQLALVVRSGDRRQHQRTPLVAFADALHADQVGVLGQLFEVRDDPVMTRVAAADRVAEELLRAGNGGIELAGLDAREEVAGLRVGGHDGRGADEAESGSNQGAAEWMERVVHGLDPLAGRRGRPSYGRGPARAGPRSVVQKR